MNTVTTNPEWVMLLALPLLLLAPLSIAGVALMNAGLSRSRSAAQFMLGCVAVTSVTVVAFAIAGAAFAASTNNATLWIAGKPWNWIGLGPAFLRHLDTAPPLTGCVVFFECIGAALGALIPWGAGADRLRIAAGIAMALVLGVFVFPLLAHWIWGGGWLASAGANLGLGAGFLDTAGAATVHVLGGMSALAVIWITGPRKGKFPKEGVANAMPGHNAIYVLSGGLLALVGSLAWNAAGALLWLHAAPAALIVTSINTVLFGAAAFITTLAVTRIRFGKPDASLCANGWMAGLVASSACAALVSPGAALFVGAVAGLITPLLVELLELAFSIDDPTGAISVHAAGGLWGLFAAGMFAPQSGQLLAQLVGIATLLGAVFPLVYLLFALLNRVVRFRVEPEGERLGMDLHELGGAAYPEFVLHRDEAFR